MALANNKILISGAGANTPGAYYQYGTQSVTAGTDVVIPAGNYILFPVANLSVKASPDGTNFNTVIAANTGAWIVSDGVNVKWSSSSGTVTALYLTVDGGQAVNGTYNNV
jgi:hypothetical protein